MGSVEKREHTLSVSATALPHEKIDELLAAAAACAEGLPSDVRRQLAVLEKLPPAQIAGRTVPVDVTSVLRLVLAHGEIVDLLSAEVARLSSALQASKQASFPL